MQAAAELVREKMNEFGNKRIPFLFIIDYELNEPFVIKLNEVDPNEIAYSMFSFKNYLEYEIGNPEIILKKYPVSYEQYKTSFEIVRKGIEEGNTYLTNLTFPTKIEINLNLTEIFLISKAKFKLHIKNRLVVFSPEEFVRIENGIISSFPMKGTIDASIPNARDIILNDDKEIAEHNTIVDLIRNDLSIVARDVYVKRFRFIDEIVTNNKKLLQVSSEITGTLGDNYESEIGNIIFAMLPAGSISGAPKRKTIEIIKDAEIALRGFYTGVFGIFDGNNLYSAVMIRFIEKAGNELFYRSGGGITYLSKPELEYQEMIDKVYVPVN